MITRPQNTNSTPAPAENSTKAESRLSEAAGRDNKLTTNNRVADAEPSGNPFQDYQVSSLYPQAEKKPSKTSATPKTKSKPTAKKRSTTSKRKSAAQSPAKANPKPRAPRKSAMRTLVEKTLIGHRKYQLEAISQVLKMFAGKAISKMGRRMDPVGSVMLEGSSGVGKSIIALMVASALQRKYGLTVAWSASPERLEQVLADNENFEIDVDLLPIDTSSESLCSDAFEADLLIVDHGAMNRMDQLIDLHESVNPQIVLGLCNPVFTNRAIRECFDEVVAANGKRSSNKDGVGKQRPGIEPLQYDDEIDQEQNGDLPVQLMLETGKDARWI